MAGTENKRETWIRASAATRGGSTVISGTQADTLHTQAAYPCDVNSTEEASQYLAAELGASTHTATLSPHFTDKHPHELGF